MLYIHIIWCQSEEDGFPFESSQGFEFFSAQGCCFFFPLATATSDLLVRDQLKSISICVYLLLYVPEGGWNAEVQTGG